MELAESFDDIGLLLRDHVQRRAQQKQHDDNQSDNKRHGDSFHPIPRNLCANSRLHRIRNRTECRNPAIFKTRFPKAESRLSIFANATPPHESVQVVRVKDNQHIHTGCSHLRSHSHTALPDAARIIAP
jgi:hypothetical protein